MFDFEYERNGVNNLFMLFAPLEDRRHVNVTGRHTKNDWEYLIKELVDERYPELVGYGGNRDWRIESPVP